MTLTRLIPSLRLTLPDPLDINLWPEATIATVFDVVVSGVSLTHVAEICGTPCVYAGTAVVPGTGGQPAPASSTRVVVFSVTRVSELSSNATVIETDADFDDLRVVWSEMRLIRRASTARTKVFLIARRPDVELARDADLAAVELPSDISAGDLVAVPTRPRATTPSSRDATAHTRSSELPAWFSHLE